MRSDKAFAAARPVRLICHSASVLISGARSLARSRLPAMASAIFRNSFNNLILSTSFESAPNLKAFKKGKDELSLRQSVKGFVHARVIAWKSVESVSGTSQLCVCVRDYFIRDLPGKKKN